MKRITPEDVVDAYQKTGFTPCFGHFLSEDGKSGCGITVVLAAEGRPIALGRIGEEAMKTMSNSYIDGFWNGFDGFNQTHGPEERVQGNADGLAARAAVLDYFTPKVLSEPIELPAAEMAFETESVSVAS